MVAGGRGLQAQPAGRPHLVHGCIPTEVKARLNCGCLINICGGMERRETGCEGKGRGKADQMASRVMFPFAHSQGKFPGGRCRGMLEGPWEAELLPSVSNGSETELKGKYPEHPPQRDAFREEEEILIYKDFLEN